MSDDDRASITLAIGQVVEWDAYNKDIRLTARKARRCVEISVDYDDVDHDAVRRDLKAMLDDLTAAGWKVRGDAG